MHAILMSSGPLCHFRGDLVRGRGWGLPGGVQRRCVGLGLVRHLLCEPPV